MSAWLSQKKIELFQSIDLERDISNPPLLHWQTKLILNFSLICINRYLVQSVSQVLLRFLQLLKASQMQKRFVQVLERLKVFTMRLLIHWLRHLLLTDSADCFNHLRKLRSNTKMASWDLQRDANS